MNDTYSIGRLALRQAAAQMQVKLPRQFDPVDRSRECGCAIESTHRVPRIRFNAQGQTYNSL